MTKVGFIIEKIRAKSRHKKMRLKEKKNIFVRSYITHYNEYGAFVFLYKAGRQRGKQ